MSNLQILLMSREASRYISDAEILRRNVTTSSHGADMLELLALEILLKCCVAIETGDFKQGHDYICLFKKLSLNSQKSILTHAKARVGPIADYSDIDDLLSLYGRNFIALRYPYEKYTHLSSDEYTRLGSEWIEKGALEEEATFIYKPNELYGLISALSEFVKNNLPNSDTKL